MNFIKLTIVTDVPVFIEANSVEYIRSCEFDSMGRQSEVGLSSRQEFCVKESPTQIVEMLLDIKKN